jgi:hypothetical protein
MFSNYKSIGNTAAAVLTVLATAGGLLWWQRASTAYPVPHPQDEAEIMTAVLERSYAMGRTNVQFVHTYPANVSIIVTNVWSNYDGAIWTTDPAHTGTCFVVYGWSTNAPAHTDTNTVDMVPRATFQFPAAIRAALPDVQIDGDNPYDYCTVQWVFPSNSFLTEGTWTSTFSDSPTNYLTVDSQWWTNFVTCATGTFLTTSNYFCPQTVVTNVVGGVTTVSVITGDTNLIISTWINTGPAWWPEQSGYWSNNITTPCTFSTRQFTNAVTNGVDTGNLFAFERDQKAQYWSTNAYNDMSRALSLMQWQKITAHSAWALQDSYVSVVPASTQSVWVWSAFYSSSADSAKDPIIVSFWTNTAPFGYMQWGNAIYTNLFQEYVPLLGTFNVQYDCNAGYYAYMYATYTPAVIQVTNTTPYTFDHGSFWNYAPTNDVVLHWNQTFPSNVVSDATMILPFTAPGTITSTTNVQLTVNDWTLPAGCSTQSVVFPVADVSAIADACAAFFINVIRYKIDHPIWFQEASDNQTITYDGDNVPWGVDDRGRPVHPFCFRAAASYHISFQSITNYLNHAPMR